MGGAQGVLSGRAYQLTLPRKRMAAGVLFLDQAQRILIVKPTYRDRWLIPGGVVEEDESPAAAGVREVREELGLDINLGRLLCLDYQSSTEERTESLQFVFYGGVLVADQMAQVVIPRDELSAYEFASQEVAASKLIPRLATRIHLALSALDRGVTVYAEDGVEL